MTSYGVTYRVRLCCGNCCSKRDFDIERGIVVTDADLICPNCGCSPVESDFKIYEKPNFVGTAEQVKED